MLDYDFVVLGVAIAFLAADGLRRGFLSWEKTLLALAWIAPLFARQLAAAALIPLGQATAIIVLALAARRSPTGRHAIPLAALPPGLTRPSDMNQLRLLPGGQNIAIPPFTCSVWPVT